MSFSFLWTSERATQIILLNNVKCSFFFIRYSTRLFYFCLSFFLFRLSHCYRAHFFSCSFAFFFFRHICVNYTFAQFTLKHKKKEEDIHKGSEETAWTFSNDDDDDEEFFLKKIAEMNRRYNMCRCNEWRACSASLFDMKTICGISRAHLLFLDALFLLSYSLFGVRLIAHTFLFPFTSNALFFGAFFVYRAKNFSCWLSVE